MGQNTFMNFDKRQAHHGLGTPLVFTGNDLMRLLLPPQPYPDFDTAFERICSGKDLSKAKSCDRARLGRLGKLPVELITYVFEATDLDGAVMLVATHPQLFAIGYASMLVKVKAMAFYNNWAYDRIICIADNARTLPPGFLSTAEKHRLMKWGTKHKAILGGDVPLDDIDGSEGGAVDGKNSPSEERDSQELESAAEVDAYPDQSFHLYQYGCQMPTLDGMARVRRWVPTPSNDLMDRSGGSDGLRLKRLRFALLWSKPCCDLDYPVLINTTKREFLKGKDQEGESMLGMATAVLTVWAGDEGYENLVKRKGEWAGDRLAVISEEEVEELVAEEDGWKEIKVTWDDVARAWGAIVTRR
ncbi:hypothetical protein CCMSSC00406_0008607 [Pleurotus cornucopiae]|uniref:Uncharacterized protein n=1 Tax=Pleurotus cornucopiae TaxID=5321 RepID=A0ACB7IHM9_PLECO|nr:hypothetical protein CCMSSC00406_0008607 [Pleurotus cornucopiae]